MKRFVLVVNNVLPTNKGFEKAPEASTRYELIPRKNLIKVYRHITDRDEWIVAYVWKCPVTGREKVFYESLPKLKFFQRMKELTELLK